ncbi:MAG: hypothetical protein S4CHLAM7_11060 [Chlamydiae bacterium]|nr:hypothetical protein [Chlamydiota bacterium]
MKDPEKEKFILQSIDKIRSLKNEIRDHKKNNVDLADLMALVQSEIVTIQNQADTIFQTDSGETLSQEDLDHYLLNPSNFSEEDWKLLDMIKSESAACKKEIIRAGEGGSAKDLIQSKKNSKLKKKTRSKRA